MDDVDRFDPEVWRRQLVRTVANLAAPAAEQVVFLTELGSAPSADDLTLEFSDMFSVLPHRQIDLKVSNSALAELREIDALLDEMSGQGNAQLWTIDALETSERWAKVRQLAADALVELESMR